MKKEISENGYLTVEAAFIFPFVILVMIAVILFSFYMYGKTGALCDCDRVLLEEERIRRNTGVIDNELFYANARKEIGGYPLCSCIVSRCYGAYSDMTVEYVLEADLLTGLVKGKKVKRDLGADNRIENARYIAVGKSIFTRVRGYARGWR